MKKVITCAFYVWGIIVFSFVMMYLMSNLEAIGNLVTGEYPILGSYYISLDKNDDGKIVSNVEYKQTIYEEEIDLENLELYTTPNVIYKINKKYLYNDQEIRKFLLKRGLAKIIDEKIASKEEIKLQNEAMENNREIWGTGNKPSGITLHKKYNEVLIFLCSNMGKFTIWFWGSVIGLSVILECIFKIRSRRRVDVIFMGGISSGKSTLVRRLHAPNISEGELLIESSPTQGSEIKQGNRIPYDNKDIYTTLYDNPGDSYGKMVDAINKFGIRKSEKKVVVYVISFTTLNSKESGQELNFDMNLVNSQISKAAAIIKMLKTNKSLKKLKRIIVFFNKCDLLFSDETLFANSYLDIERKFRKAEDFNELKRNADILIYGSALKSWKFEKLIKEIIG